ncbi:hypothetical protein MXM84_10350 [Acinetobacter pittii]|uniref:hypothetical protein n=1 Tax=Acinetobacter pittii TaxID=48296 RepID=UPI002DBA9C6B|nr:hypothetical protein [Acinetobacter pittii]MEB6624897.1 hypothetical protein [Acinetobacter pittii]
MKNQLFLFLNDKKVVWDFEKSPILTVTESDLFQIFIPLNFAQEIEFFIEDYEIVLSQDTEYFYCEKIKIFAESFGISVGRLCLDGKIFEIGFDVLAKKITAQKIESMLGFLYKNNKEILNICFSRTQKEKLFSEIGVAEPEVLIKQAEIFVNKFMEFRQDFSSNLKKRLVPQQVPVWKSRDKQDFLEIEDFFENLDRLSPSVGEGDIFYNGRFFSIDRTYKTELFETTATYENSTILGGAQATLDKIREISNFLIENFLIGKSYDREYESLGECIARVTYASLSNRCKSLIINLEEIIKFLKFDLKIPYKGQLLPQVTPYVRGIKVYRILFDQIALWYKLGTPDFSGLNFLSKIRSLSKIYELYCLYKIYELFHNQGWEVVHAKKSETLGSDIPSCVTFSYKEEIIEIYYEKRVFGLTSSTIHLDLIDLYHKSHWNYNFYNPDYIIKHIKGDDVNYLILDAKYSNHNTVRNIHLPKIYEKYYMGMGVVDLKNNIVSSQKIVAISVLYPNSANIFSNHKDNHIQKVKDIIRLPLYTGVSVQDENDESLEIFIENALDASLKLFNMNSINV